MGDLGCAKVEERRMRFQRGESNVEERAEVCVGEEIILVKLPTGDALSYIGDLLYYAEDFPYGGRLY